MAEKEFTLEDLAKFNGLDGKPMYVAFEGKVYDMSASTMWEDGIHLGVHPAGRDLTAEMGEAPHGPEAMEDFPQVGLLKQA
jgi:predicted heme/steroid binding protein